MNCLEKWLAQTDETPAGEGWISFGRGLSASGGETEAQPLYLARRFGWKEGL
jgi:hypothetical protein